MKLSEHLRETDLKLPIHIIAKRQIINQPTAEGYVELIVLSKQTSIAGDILYKIQFLSNTDHNKANEVRWVSGDWCAHYTVEIILAD